MSTEQTLTRGTRVEITDLNHEWYGFKGEVLDTELGVLVTFERWESSIVTPDQLKVIEQPEPTVGQLVDAMHQEIERVCERKTWAIMSLTIQTLPINREHAVIVRFYNNEALRERGDTPQAALRAMIERLREIGGDK